jgi:hypothetical protein
MHSSQDTEDNHVTLLLTPIWSAVILDVVASSETFREYFKRNRI